VTEAFSFSRRVASGSFLPNREIMPSRAQVGAQHKIVTEARVENGTRKTSAHR
jgi:hypothetical protein